MDKLPELSVFFPAYNEESNLEKTIREADLVCNQIAEKYEIIIVNDGSIDNTQQVAEKLAQENTSIKILNHSPNRGYGAALKTGMYNSQYEYIAFNDSDGQFDFSQITHFLPHLSNYDMVIGYRKKRVEGFARLLNAKAWGTLVNVAFNVHFKDIDCAFKVFRKKVIETIPKLESEGALISTELLVKTKRAGFKIREIPVDHLPRKAGRPTGANPRVILKAFVELFKLWKKIR